MLKLLIISLFSTLSFSAELPSVQSLSGGAIDASNAQTIADDQFQPQMTITAEDFNAKFKALKILIDNIEQPQLPEPQLTLLGGNAPAGYPSNAYSDDYTSYLTSNSGVYISAPVDQIIEMTIDLNQSPYNGQNFDVNFVDFYFEVDTGGINNASSISFSSESGFFPSGVSAVIPMNDNQFSNLNPGDIVKVRFEINTQFQSGSNYMRLNIQNSGLKVVAESSLQLERMGESLNSTAIGYNFEITVFDVYPIMQLFQ